MLLPARHGNQLYLQLALPCLNLNLLLYADRQVGVILPSLAS